MAFPYCNQVDILTAEPRLVREKRYWNDEDRELTEQRNGAYQCPKCGLWWPLIEQPEAWELSEETGRWDAIEWWGCVVCEVCRFLMVDQPDGTPECYDLNSDETGEL